MKNAILKEEDIRRNENNNETTKIDTIDTDKIPRFEPIHIFNGTGSVLRIRNQITKGDYIKINIMNGERIMFFVSGKTTKEKIHIESGIVRDRLRSTYSPLHKNETLDMGLQFERFSLFSFQSELSKIGYEFNPETNKFKKQSI